MLNQGVVSGTEKVLLSKQSYESITTATVLTSGKGSDGCSIKGYAKGWMRYSYQGIEVRPPITP